jgi:hypothetical protein
MSSGALFQAGIAINARQRQRYLQRRQFDRLSEGSEAARGPVLIVGTPTARRPEFSL